MPFKRLTSALSVIGRKSFNKPRMCIWIFRVKKKMYQFMRIKLITAIGIYNSIFYRSSFFKLRGYDFHFENIGVETPSGRADVENGIVYSYGCNEFYPHELIHLFLNLKYPNAHSWFIEGFATYYGQSRGQPLEWHLKKLKDYLNEHPEIDLNSPLNLVNMDHVTGYKYALGGLFVKIAFEQGGVNKVRLLLDSGNSNEDFFLALEAVLGIERNSLNSYIRNYLNSAF